MYFSELPDCVKYKLIRAPKKVLQRIVERHNDKISNRWQQIDYIIYEQDWLSCLLIEKTQEEIVEEIKKWIEENIQNIRKKHNLDLQEVENILFIANTSKYVVDFERIEPYVELSDIYEECFPRKKEYKPVIIKWEKIDLPDIEDLKRIPILSVLDKLWIEYKKVWYDTYALYEHWRWTDWWRANTTQNIVTDFSSKWRAHWNPFHFVSIYLWTDVKETSLRFKDNWLC